MKRSKIDVIAIFFLFLIGGSSYSQSTDKLSLRLQTKIAQATETAIYPVWIYFTDKGMISEQTLADVEQRLLPKARNRRWRQALAGQRLVDKYDVPICKEYLTELKPLVVKIRQKSRWLNAISAEVTAGALKRIIELPFVEKLDIVFIADAKSPIQDIQPASEPTMLKGKTDSLNYGQSYAQNNQINVIPLHNLGYNGSGVLIAMLDAGFNNLEHEALRHLNILATWDFVNGDSIVWDEPGQMGSGNHGTYTLSALAGFKEGFLIGPAFGADFILAKTENTEWERHIEEDAWIAGAEWADSLGADIISSSLGYLNEFTYPDTNYTWRDMDGNTTIVTKGADIAASRGILVVNSAGNEGAATPPQNTLIAPADGDSVMAVGSVTESGSRSLFSSMGPTVDGRIKPDVMARGSGTLCASPYDSAQYWNVSGTSLSCPLAAAAAALVWQVNPTFTNMQVLDALRHTASRSANPDNAYGWGIIDAYAAAFQVTSHRPIQNPVSEKFILYANYPNPFNPRTTISYEIPQSAEIQIAVYNAAGELVHILFKGVLPAGKHQQVWNAAQLSSGMYYITLTAREYRLVRKALLLK